MTDTLYDVFLSYEPLDDELVSLVEQAFTDAGLTSFRAADHLAKRRAFGTTMREAIIGAAAAVALITPRSFESTAIPLEIGAAASWNKPIYLLLDGVDEADVFLFARKHSRLYPAAQLDRLVHDVKRDARPLDDQDRTILREVFIRGGLTTDQLLARSEALEQLADEFSSQADQPLPPDRLAMELVRMRKQGDLSKWRQAAPVPA